MQGEIYTCKNGLTVIVNRQTAFPVVSVQVWVGTGAEHEGEHAGAGLSHLIEHMVFKGTSELSAQQLNEEVAALGGIWNAYTSTDRTVYHIDGPAANCRRFTEILLQLVYSPTFPADEFEKEREVIRREMAMYNDDPRDASYRALVGTLYKVHPKRLPVIGEQKRFDALTHDDMVAYHRNRYTPGNMFVCVAGDVTPAEVFSMVEDAVAAIPARAAVHHAPVQEPRQWGKRLYRTEFAQPTSTLMLAWRIPHARHADAAPLAVLASVLGDGRAAWLYKKFHDETAQAHDVSASVMPDKEGEGAFIIEADAERTNRDALCDALLGVFGNKESAIVDVIKGDYKPTGKLPITMVAHASVIALETTEFAHSTWEVCVSPCDVPGYVKDQYMREDVLAASPSGSYAYKDANGNLYFSDFGLTYP